MSLRLWGARRWGRRCLTSGDNGKVNVHHVDAENIGSMKESMQQNLKAALFVGVDCEFTGLNRERQQGHIALQSLNERYRELRRTLLGKGFSHKDGHRMQGFLIVQVGLTCFQWCNKEHRYIVNVYSIYLSPKPWSGLTNNVKVEHDLLFGCLASALKFLSRHGFDFNRWLNHGVPFIQRSVYLSERDKLQSRGQSLLLEELDSGCGFLDIWDAVLNCGKPLVGHQCLLDFLYLWHQMEAPLPQKLPDFLHQLSNKVGLTIDTKHLLTAYPEDLRDVLEKQVVSLKQQRLKKNDPILAEKEDSCNELMGYLRKGGGGLKHLQLLDLYNLWEPLVRESLPYLPSGKILAHDAGVDSYLTGVVFAALHGLIHTQSSPPSLDFLVRNHSKKKSNSNPLLGSPAAFPYANQLHVFASPVPLEITKTDNLPGAEESHANTYVILPPVGGMVESGKLTQLLSSFNTHADLYWIEFQRIAVIQLRIPRKVPLGGQKDISKTLNEGLCKLLEPYRWKVIPALEWLKKARPPKLKKLSNDQLPPRHKLSGNQKRTKGELASLRKRRSAWLRKRLKAAFSHTDKLQTNQHKLLEAKQQSGNRLQEVIELKRQIAEYKALGMVLEQEEEKRRTAEQKLNEITKKHGKMQENKTKLEADQEAIERQTTALQQGIENYRKQCDSLREQLATSVLKSERLERDIREKDAQHQHDGARMAAETDKVRQQLSATLHQLNTPPPDQTDDKVKKIKLKRIDKKTEAPPKAVPTRLQNSSTDSSPKQNSKNLVPRVEESRPSQWVIERQEGNNSKDIDIMLHTEAKKQQTIDMKECRRVRLFLKKGTLKSITFTNCERVSIFCESSVTEPSKSWSWDSRAVTGPRIFYYGSDKSTISIQVLKQEKWPDIRQIEKKYYSSTLKARTGKQKVAKNSTDLGWSLLMTAGTLLVLQLLIASISSAQARQQQLAAQQQQVPGSPPVSLLDPKKVISPPS